MFRQYLACFSEKMCSLYVCKLFQFNRTEVGGICRCGLDAFAIKCYRETTGGSLNSTLENSLSSQIPPRATWVDAGNHPSIGLFLRIRMHKQSVISRCQEPCHFPPETAALMSPYERNFVANTGKKGFIFTNFSKSRIVNGFNIM